MEQKFRSLKKAGYDVLTIQGSKGGMTGAARFMFTAGVHAASMRPDILVARDLDALYPAVWAKKRTGARLVYDCHDIYPWMIENDAPHAAKAAKKRERRLLQYVDLLLTLNHGTASWVIDRQGYVGPHALVRQCRNPDKEWTPPPNARALCYLGTLHNGRFVKELVRAVNDGLDVDLHIAGPQTPGGLYDWVAKNTSALVTFYGEVSPMNALKILRGCDVSVQMADPLVRINTVGPYNRFFDALSVGRASIGTLGTANGAMIEETRTGIQVPYRSQDFIKGVNTLFDMDPAMVGRRAYETCAEGTLNWREQEKRFLAAFEELIWR
jgi:hypothetical protein